MSEPWFGVLVTGTHDIEAARAEAEDVVRTNVEESDRAQWWADNPPELQVGRIVPAGPDWRDDGVAWWWRTGYKLGKPGVTRAVLFSHRGVNL